MACVEKRGQWYRVVFRHEGRRYTHTLSAIDALAFVRKVAEAVTDGAEFEVYLIGTDQ